MNPILRNLNQNTMKQNPLDAINQLKQIAGGNPNAAYNLLMQSNPRFRQFVDENRGKTPEQIASEHGINMGLIDKFIH